jgi:hypothetical protein
MSTDNSSLIEELLKELDEDSIAEMDMDTIIAARKKLNPYGRTIEGSNKYLTFSYTNLSQKYMQKFLTTALIGYLNRALDEWEVPDGIPVVTVYDYARNPKIMDELTAGWKIDDKLRAKLDENAKMMRKRVIVKEFLEHLFQYNPDEHIRSAYRPNPKDVTRPILTTPAANLAVNELKKVDVKFLEDMRNYDRVQNILFMNGDVVPSDAPDEFKELVAKKLVLPDTHYSVMDFAKWSAEDRNLLRTVCEMIPPASIYHNFNNYLETNYDKLNEATQYLYCDKPDFDIAVNPYEWHETREAAEDFQKKHANEVIADIIIADSGKWNIVAKHGIVQEKTKFYNEHTAILEEMVAQQERDAKLGADLVKHRVVKKKKQNIKEEGPDAELFSKWKSENATLKEMGATMPDQDAYLDKDIPDDSVQIDVFRIGKGGLEMKKEHIFTQAQAPTMPENKENKA